MTVIRHMKRAKWFLLLIMIGILAGCSEDSNTTAGSVKVEGSHPVRSVHVNVDADQKDSTTQLQQGSFAKVTGLPKEKTGVNPKYVQFINQNTGWFASSSEIPSRIRFWHTTDGGHHWDPYVTNLSDISVFQFTDARNGWALAALYCGEGCLQPEIVHTEDGGRNWIPQHTFKNTVSSMNLGTIQMIDSQHGFVLYRQTLLATSDGGSHWTPMKFTGFDSTADFQPSSMSWISKNFGWVDGVEAGQRERILHTTDGGQHWNIAHLWNSGIRNVTIHITQDGTGWAMSNHYKDQNYFALNFYKTTDNGRHWTFVHTLKANEANHTIVSDPHFLGHDIIWISLSDHGGNFPDLVALSTDGARHFNDMSDRSRLDMISAKEGWAIGANAVDHTTDGGHTWKQEFPSLFPKQQLQFLNEKEGYGLGDQSDPMALLHTTDGGITWKKVGSLVSAMPTNRTGTPSLKYISFSDSNNGWAVYSVRTPKQTLWYLLCTKDGGQHWSPISGKAPKQLDQEDTSLYSFWSTDNDQASMLIGQKLSDQTSTWLLVTTTDSGKHWSESKISNQALMPLHLKKGWRAMNQWNAISVSYIHSKQKAFLVEHNEDHTDMNQFEWITTKDGRNWIDHDVPTWRSHNVVQVDQLNQQEIWMLTRTGILHSSDAGANWKWID